MKTTGNSENENKNDHVENVKKAGKLSHAEDWETDSYSGDENDVKSEMEIRSHTKGSGGDTHEFTGENLHWDRGESGNDSEDNNSGDEYRESDNGRDETMGIP